VIQSLAIDGGSHYANERDCYDPVR
jgi:hypothetical protein